MALLERMLRSIGKSEPQFGRFMRSLGNALQIQQQLTIETLPEKRLAVRCLNSVAAQQQMFMVAADMCFTSLEWSGATTERARKYEDIVREAANKSFPKHRVDEISKIYKIALQVLAHYNDPSQRLHNYARFLMRQQFQGGPYMLAPQQLEKMASQKLIGTIITTRISLEQMNAQLYEKMPGIVIEDLAHAVAVAQIKAVTVGEKILCPLVGQLTHSLNPNCSLDGIYLSHLQQSFVCVNSNKKIAPNEELTISYGDLGNIELYIRHGIVLPNNPHSFYMLGVSYDDDLHWLGRLFEFKEKLLADAGGLKDFIKINRKDFNAESLAPLRVFFLSEEDIMQNKDIVNFSLSNFERPINGNNERRVKKFLLRWLEKQTPPTPSNVPDAAIIENEDQQIYRQTLARVKRELAE